MTIERDYSTLSDAQVDDLFDDEVDDVLREWCARGLAADGPEPYRRAMVEAAQRKPRLATRYAAGRG